MGIRGRDTISFVPPLVPTLFLYLFGAHHIFLRQACVGGRRGPVEAGRRDARTADGKPGQKVRRHIYST